jgi:hypothetical protein
MINETNILIGLILFVPMVLLFAMLDYILFSENSACEKCGLKPKKYDWLMACFLETFMFLVGFIAGTIL